MQRGGAGIVEKHGHTDTRRRAGVRRDAIPIDTATEFNVPTRGGLKPVLREQREVRAVHRLDAGTVEIQSPRKRAIGALDQDRSTGARPLVPIVQEVEPDLEQVYAANALVRVRRRFNPLIRRGVPMLKIEEVPQRRFWQQLHGRGPLAGYVRPGTGEIGTSPRRLWPPRTKTAR